MKPIFVFGSGPSLIEQKGLMRQVSEYPTFCCNRVHEWDGLCFTPTYYACNLRIIELGIVPESPPFTDTKFIISRGGEEREGWVAYAKIFGDEPLALEGNQLRPGGTMPFLSAQIAVRLGYKDVYFLGIEQYGEGHCYDPEGKLWPHRAKPADYIFERWREAKEFYADNGISMRDCTPGGRLNDILGYMPLEEALSGS